MPDGTGSLHQGEGTPQWSSLWPDALSQTHTTAVVPILAGGGTRLPAHVGVLKALQDLGVRTDHLVGVSGGSIVAALWCTGWSADAMRELALEVDFTRFRDFNLRQLLFHGGLSSGDRFEAWMDEQLGGARFRDLQRDLHVVATDVRTGSPVVFDFERCPDMRVAEAVRYSMSIPLLFAFKEYDDHLMVDGSILSEDALRRDWSGTGTPSCCFRLRADTTAKERRERRWFPLPDYLLMLVRSFMTSMSHEFVQNAYWNATVVIETGSISPLEFRLPAEKKMELYDLGYDTTQRIFPMKFGQSQAQPPGDGGELQPNSA